MSDIYAVLPTYGVTDGEPTAVLPVYWRVPGTDDVRGIDCLLKAVGTFHGTPMVKITFRGPNGNETRWVPTSQTYR